MLAAHAAGRPRSSPLPVTVPLSSGPGRRIVATTVLGAATVMLTATVVNVAIPQMAADLGASSAEQKWVLNAYLLTMASLILVGGSLGDRYGRLHVYRAGVTVFGHASVACALAPGTAVLLAARLVQGVGAALLAPGSLAIIDAGLERRDRGRAVGLWTGFTGVAAATGPLVGGALVELSWRWVFLLNLPLAVAVLVLSRSIPETRDPAAGRVPFDAVGAGLVTLGLAGLSFALVQGPEQGFSAVDLAAAVVALALPAAYLWERRHPEPVVPIDLFADRSFVAASVVTLLVYGGLGVMLFLLSLQLQVTAGWSPLEAGSALLPVTALMLLLSARAGDLARRIGARLPLSVGPLVMGAGMLLATRVGADASYLGDLVPATVVFGLGLATTVAPVTATALGSVPDGRAGAASGANNALARTGQLLAVAAVPGAVGLTGGALSDPARLGAGFGPAMTLAAAFTGAAGVLAWLLLANETPAAREEEEEEAAAGELPSPRSCAIDAPPPDPATHR